MPGRGRDGKGRSSNRRRPLYPAIVAAVGWLTGLTAVQASTLTSSLLILLGTYVGVLYLRETRPGASVAPFIILTLIGAGAFYLNAVYTELLFYALTCCAFLSWSRGHNLTTGIIGALLSATRAVGVFFVVAIVVDLLCRHRGRIFEAIHRRPKLALVIALCLPCRWPPGLDSFSRFVVGCPVLAFAATDLLNRLRPAWLAWLAIGASAALNVWLLSEWMNNVEFLT